MHSRPFPACRSGRTLPVAARAFTLIELLASMSVLVLVMALVLQMMNSAMALANGSAKRLDADSQARLVFDRMAVDFLQIAKRQDVDYYFQKNGTGQPGTDDQMAFYSETSGYYPAGTTDPAVKSNAALVGYCIRKNSGDNKRQLVRLSKALVWNGAGSARAMTFLPQTLPAAWPLVFNGATNPDMTQSTDTDYQVIGEQVFRMEICYLVRNATTPPTLSDTPYLPVPPATTTPTTPPYPYNALRDVAAVVVTLAVLDNKSRMIAQATDIDAAAAKLQDVTGNPLSTSTPASLWQKQIDTSNLSKESGGGGLPQAVAGQVRIYERYFPLGNAQ